MNAYFLVEGKRSERRLYPSWLRHLAPKLVQVHSPREAVQNSYYLISGEGYPSLLHDHLLNAILDIEMHGGFDYLVVVLDADEDSVESRRREVEQAVTSSRQPLTKTALRIVVQNRCIETWLLGNKRVYVRNPQEPVLRGYTQFYNVAESDPELMGVLPSFNTHSQFHTAYIKALFTERGLSYTKRNPGHAQDVAYLEQLIGRIETNPTHLQTFACLCELVSELTAKLEN